MAVGKMVNHLQTLDGFLLPTWGLITHCNSSSGDLELYSGSMGNQRIPSNMHICRQNTHKCKNENKYLKFHNMFDTLISI